MWQRIKKIFSGWRRGPQPRGKHILVIDDGELERHFLLSTLTKNGFDVSCADRGEKGIRLAMEIKPDMIIMDYSMPGMNGDEVCRRLKEMPETQKIPVIFLTGSASPKSVIECYDGGADYFLAKPISARMLIQQIELTFEDVEAGEL